MGCREERAPWVAKRTKESRSKKQTKETIRGNGKEKEQELKQNEKADRRTDREKSKGTVIKRKSWWTPWKGSQDSEARRNKIKSEHRTETTKSELSGRPVEIGLSSLFVIADIFFSFSAALLSTSANGKCKRISKRTAGESSKSKSSHLPANWFVAASFCVVLFLISSYLRCFRCGQNSDCWNARVGFSSKGFSSHCCFSRTNSCSCWSGEQKIHSLWLFCALLTLFFLFLFYFNSAASHSI